MKSVRLFQLYFFL